MAVWEIVRIVVPEGRQEEFEAVVRSHLPLLDEEKGCLDAKLFRAIDKEGVILLCVQWESVEYHTEVFAQTEAFVKFSSAMAPFFAEPPEAFHADAIIDGFRSA
ncbi:MULTISPECIES: antibiotic biosynthesis monooxygenase family protein [unclassified Streptomyces]|uniref:antibiotic biosynthesis monooxygenase family protein n=1 Tax=unclassified Streptomyces TaxID=2593676 RepID=UPI000DBA4841|nr:MULTISPECIES: antibiotic biosynthesis monooxygenase family protein [unclassified Streptomyces]MYT68156.1 antibiotic biosynthesis monooxygenase [Streptomyces sp. SID8367]RAJ72722.1 quinol monooxygenase YgiN [Streptomyces sp. PsTaAH-137]